MQRYWLIYYDLDNVEGLNQITGFISKGIWETNNESHKETILQIKKDDLLFTNVGGNADYIKQISKGKVLENPRDGRKLKVKWEKHFYNVQIEVTKEYKTGLSEILQHEILTFISTYIFNLKHALATTDNDENLENEGYKVQGLLGYIQKKEINQETNDLIPLYQFYIKNAEDYFYYNDIKEETLDKNDLEENSLLVGYLNNESEQNEGLKLYRYFSKEPFDHFYATKPNKNVLEILGYKIEKIEGFLWDKPSRDRLPLYVYSTKPDLILFEPLLEKPKDANIISDNPAKIDELGRDKFMGILYDKVNKIWNAWEPHQNFTILLNGEWGSGKSSMLNYLKIYLEKGNWQIIEYNAWEHQHVKDQWWILINKISKKLTSNSYDRTTSSHNFWKFRLKNRNSILFLFLIIVFLASLFLFTNILLTNAADTRTQELIVSLIGVVATLFVAIIGIVQNIFTRNINTSQLASNYTSDPYKPIKERFKEVTKNKKVAVLIDDLDRCEVEPTVGLLEGIQNLFKSTKILYVIAADGNWVSNCFEKKYIDFKDLKKDGSTVGYQFLQKAFQLIVDVPKIGDMEYKKLWKNILGVTETEEESLEDSNQEVQPGSLDINSVDQAIDASTSESINIRVEAAQKVEEIIDDHILLEYLDITPNNPREMKRLVNQFTVKLQSLVISGTAQYITSDVLIRYIIFASRYPNYDKKIKTNEISLKDLADKNPKIAEIIGEELNDDIITEYL